MVSSRNGQNIFILSLFRHEMSRNYNGLTCFSTKKTEHVNNRSVSLQNRMNFLIFISFRPERKDVKYFMNIVLRT
jgi:hypothetical protein